MIASPKLDESLPRPLRRLVNLLRRLPFLSPLLGSRPIEPGVRSLYSRYIMPEDVVVEVGARMGDGTRVLANIATHVYSFEPSKESFLILRTMTRTHHNVDAYNIALGDSTGEAYLNKDRSFSGVASIKKLAAVNYAAQEKVKVTALDNIRFKLEPTSLVIDCEGFESEVLKGAQNSLPQLRSVLVETHTLSDGSNTLDPVTKELERFFRKVTVATAGQDHWVLAQRE